MPRRVASTYLIVDGKRLTNHIVELDCSKVTSYYPLEEELAMTEWLGGTIKIIGDKAYHKSSAKNSEFRELK